MVGGGGLCAREMVRILVADNPLAVDGEDYNLEVKVCEEPHFRFHCNLFHLSALFQVQLYFSVIPCVSTVVAVK